MGSYTAAKKEICKINNVLINVKKPVDDCTN